MAHTNEKQRVTVDIGGTTLPEEIKEIIARMIGVANREKGFAGTSNGVMHVALMPGLELVLGVRNGNNIDPLIRLQMQYAMPSGKFVAAFFFLPVNDDGSVFVPNVNGMG